MDKHFRSNYIRNISGGLMGAFVVAVANYMATYLRQLGGGDYHYAMLSALPGIVAVLSLVPGAMLIDATKNKLRTVTLICLLSRGFFLLFGLVPLLPPLWRPLALVVLVGLRNAPESVWLIGYQSLVADVFSKEQLNDIIGTRNKYNSMLTIVSTFALGAFLTLNERFDIGNLTLFQILFVFTFAVGLWEVLQYRKFRFDYTPPVQQEKFTSKLWCVIRGLPGQKQYMTYCLTVIVFYVGWQMAWPLYSIYQLDVLGANAAWVGYISIVSTTSQVLTTGLWIKLTRKIGSRPVLGICMVLMAVTPALYTLCSTLPQLTAMQIITGSGMSGVIFLVFNELLVVCPDKNRTLYISLFTMITQVSSAIVPFLGTYIKQEFSIYTALYASTVVRLIGAGILLVSCYRAGKARDDLTKS